MMLPNIADLERRLRRLEMESDQSRHKIVAPDRSVTESPPLTRAAAAIDHGSLSGLGDDDHTQYAMRTGWNPDTNTWVYVSAASFKITGKDVTSRFPVGTKIKLTQTSVKYFYVTASSYSTDTTITIMGGSDYSLADAAISDPYYSYAETPQGFPDWFNWTPTQTGWTALPSGAYRYCLRGKTCQFYIDITSGTSNGTTTRLTLPLMPKSGVYWGGANGMAMDNGTVLSVASKWYVNSADGEVYFGADMGSGLFTASGTKRVRCEGFYEIA